MMTLFFNHTKLGYILAVKCLLLDSLMKLSIAEPAKWQRGNEDGQLLTEI